MSRVLIAVLGLVGGFMVTSITDVVQLSSVRANATEATIQKQKKKQPKTNFNQPRPKKKDYCGYAQEPNPAGMSDYCTWMYIVYCRRGVGCSQYGREI